MDKGTQNAGIPVCAMKETQLQKVLYSHHPTKAVVILKERELHSAGTRQGIYLSSEVNRARGARRLPSKIEATC